MVQNIDAVGMRSSPRALEKLLDDNRRQRQPQRRFVEDQQRWVHHQRSLAIANICCSPPERVRAAWVCRDARIGNRSNSIFAVRVVLARSGLVFFACFAVLPSKGWLA
jgi:hypothetical protein